MHWPACLPACLTDGRTTQRAPAIWYMYTTDTSFTLLYTTTHTLPPSRQRTAPCYKRMRNGGREADFPERMEKRALDTAEFIRCVVVDGFGVVGSVGQGGV